MKIHILEHDPMETVGTIAEWASAHAATMATTRCYLDEPYPEVADWDLLVVMGGPMNVYECSTYPWLGREKDFLRKRVTAGDRILGVCLGAQLLADVLGAKVTRNEHTEIGWHPVQVTPEFRALKNFGDWPSSLFPFHWHGDTFAIPEGAVALGSSAACAHQGFALRKILALQFHLEFDPPALQGLIAATESWDGPWVQAPEEFLQRKGLFQESRRQLFSVLDRWLGVGR